MNDMFPLEEVYEVKNGEMIGIFSYLSKDDLESWKEEGLYPELFELLDSGTTRIRETKENATSLAEWFAA